MPRNEEDKRTHLNEINWLQKELAFLEKIYQTTKHESSRKSLENSIELLKGSQDKLRNSLYVKHGITLDKVGNIIEKNNAKSKAIAPQLKPEQGRFAHDLFTLKKEKDSISRQLSDSRLPLEISKTLEQKLVKKEQEYKDKLTEITKRPDKDVIMDLWTKLRKNEKRSNEKTPDKMHDYPSRTR